MIRGQKKNLIGVKKPLQAAFVLVLCVSGCVRGHMIGRCCRLVCLPTRGGGGGGGQSGVSSTRGVSVSRHSQTDRTVVVSEAGVNLNLDFYRGAAAKEVRSALWYSFLDFKKCSPVSDSYIHKSAV